MAARSVAGDRLRPLTFPVPASAAATVQTFARFRLDQGGGLSFDGLAPDGEVEDYEVAIDTQADLSITKTDSDDPVLAGNNLTYTVTVSNAGPSDAQNVVVTDTLPAGVTFVSTNGCAEDPNGVPTCGLGNIAAGGSAQYTITVTVDSSTTGTITNSATVASDTTDLNGGNDTATEQTTVNTEADLSIAKMDTDDPVLAGSNLIYTLTVTNNGPSDAQNVVVTDTLPGGTAYVSNTDSCIEGPAGTLTCTLGVIPDGDCVSFDVTVDVDPSLPDGTMLFNMASVSSDTTDPVPVNNTVTEVTLVITEGVIPLVRRFLGFFE
jgi:uncharacterized repeat protein (TIGR01451 family)